MQSLLYSPNSWNLPKISGLSLRKWNQETNPMRFERKVCLRRYWDTKSSPFVDTRKDQLIFWGPLPSCCPPPPTIFVFANNLVARSWAQGVHFLFPSSTFRTGRSCCCIACPPAKPDVQRRIAPKVEPEDQSHQVRKVCLQRRWVAGGSSCVGPR